MLVLEAFAHAFDAHRAGHARDGRAGHGVDASDQAARHAGKRRMGKGVADHGQAAQDDGDADQGHDDAEQDADDETALHEHVFEHGLTHPLG